MSKSLNSWSSIPYSQRERLRQFVFARDGRCMIGGPKCTGAAEELDHIIARKDGGRTLDPANCRASCRPCNRGRRDRKPAGQWSAPPSREW